MNNGNAAALTAEQSTAGLPQNHPEQPRLSVRLAETAADLRAAQRLRYQIFALEQGAQLSGAKTGYDADHFDAHCEHLLVFAEGQPEPVATTRFMNSAAAQAAGGFYSEQEFQLDAIRKLPGNLLELGRTCVAAEYRDGSVIAKLWQGLGAYLEQHPVDYIFGCASIAWGDDGAMPHALMARFRGRYMSEAELRVQPRLSLPAAASDNVTALVIPPLLKAYVAMGAKVCGEPYWDEAFQVADLFMLLPIASMDARYKRRFFGQKVA